MRLESRRGVLRLGALSAVSVVVPACSDSSGDDGSAAGDGLTGAPLGGRAGKGGSAAASGGKAGGVGPGRGAKTGRPATLGRAPSVGRRP
ncbi:MAG TPA: hypothetical protein VGP93_10720 [Polyangiaceae bacterium]|nr:hypothetical protein [Polyangiaceae bacterium]